MKENKTPAPSGNRERAKAETAALGAAISCNHDNIGGTVRQVADVLGVGEENALRMEEIRRIIDGDARSIRLEIERERRMGVAICSNNKTGYYLAATRQEIETFCRSMRRRAAEIQKTAALVHLAGLDSDAGNGG